MHPPHLPVSQAIESRAGVAGVLQEAIRAKDTAGDRGRQCGRCRCKNLGTTGFAETAMQATRRHIFRRRLFFGRLKNTDLRTCANCKRLTVRHFKKHPVPGFLYRNYTDRKPGTSRFRQTWQYGRSSSTADLEYSRFCNTVGQTIRQT